jgi:hypothetical protein
MRMLTRVGAACWPDVPPHADRIRSALRHDAAGAAAVVIDRTDFVQRAVPLIKSAAWLPANTAAQKFLI